MADIPCQDFAKQNRVRETAGLQGACGGYEKGVGVDDGERRRSTTTIPSDRPLNSPRPDFSATKG